MPDWAFGKCNKVIKKHKVRDAITESLRGMFLMTSALLSGARMNQCLAGPLTKKMNENRLLSILKVESCRRGFKLLGKPGIEEFG